MSLKRLEWLSKLALTWERSFILQIQEMWLKAFKNCHLIAPALQLWDRIELYTHTDKHTTVYLACAPLRHNNYSYYDTVAVYIDLTVGCLADTSTRVNRKYRPSSTCWVSSLRGSLATDSRLPVGSWNRSIGGICSLSSLWRTSLSRSLWYLCTRDAHSSLWPVHIHVHVPVPQTPDYQRVPGTEYWVLQREALLALTEASLSVHC